MGYSPAPQPPTTTNHTGPVAMMQQMIFNNLYQNNAQFKQFADSMMGKNPVQAFQEQGLDYNQYKNIDPMQIKNAFGI